ncbi:MAG: hypothetical protein KKE02_06920 [Alphaproteobacteria bacterium]|nr:hypothetical protein [Alphaproteobacteria bacterium]MBU1515494.1 hypothetical protein [Alphaproteobacteria bacterium]MBU2095492.1 hypothetical protein [Alphaproteobacteria bacterium]MBU2150733.1 hypothetical protein [Alphaproteobacteria bacterium]MBU2306998.1 hypothetical protein [Alphaproteobacteria bacterium]
MFKLFSGAAPVPARTEPTALLKLVAGDFAPAVARLWPEPHTPFLTASATRRHLVCLGFALDRDVGVLALTGRLREAIGAVLGSSPPGLERALGRLGETAWTAATYRKLLELLPEPKPAKLLRHAETIDQGAVARLSRLPAPMGRSLGLAMLITDDGATAVAEAAGAIAVRSGAEAAIAAATRWADAETEAALFEAVREDLYPELPAPPFAGTATLRPLATKAALREAARRYENCLATRVNHAVGGFAAYYEWTEGEGAVVEISRDAIFGWRLEEAKGPSNDVLDKDARAALIAELTALGVYVGRSGWQIERALSADAGRGWRLPTVADDLAEVFGD